MEPLTSNPKTNKLLKKMGIYSYEQVLEHLPRKYEFLSLTKESDIKDKAKVVLFGKVATTPVIGKGWKVVNVSFSFYSVALKRSFNVIAYNRKYIAKAINVGDELTLWGSYDYRNNSINLTNYTKGAIKEGKDIRPIYSLVAPMNNYEYSNIVKLALKETKDKLYSLVPFYFQNKYRLISKYDSFALAHFPKSKEDIHQALRHLKYEEALLFSLQNKLIHEDNKSLAKVKKEPIGLDICEPFLKELPFKLNEDQINACNEIIDDMNRSSLMYRMLQGDVGTGKTVVSFVAMYANYYRGDQGAIMAPTEALAKQHYKNALEMFKFSKIKVALLVGSTPTKEKERIYQDLEDGTIDIVVGTHALFTKKVKYSSLGLVIIDEQHRFGVNQRQALLDKGKHADLLMMSATPIPRSLALTIYGDLDITTLTTFPTKEKRVTTKIVNVGDPLIDKCINHALELNQKVYIVAPLIELQDNRFSVEELYKDYVDKYHEKVGLLHGDLSNDDKEKALDDFINGEKPILVSTQVIEVGIDVKEATLMVIYDATNFGLASLHQLRGRVGRDGSKAACLLVTSEDDDTKDKLRILEESFDGFKIAEEDMKNRGPGDLSGIRQSGLPNFYYLNIIDDIRIFTTARDDANYIFMHQDEKQFSYIVNRIRYRIEHSDTIKKN